MTDPVRLLADRATPGRWMAVNHGLRIEISGDEFHVAQIDTSYDTDFDRGQCEADGRLIALAPDLARVAADLAEALTHEHPDEDPQYVGTCVSCRALAAYRELQERAKGAT